MDTLKPQSNGPLYNNTVIGTLAVDGHGTTGRVLDWLGAPPSPLLAVSNVTTHPVYQLHIIQRGTVIASASPVHTGNRVDCCRYGRLCCRFWQQIGNNLNSTACRGRHCRQLGRLCRPNVERPFDFVASVYRA